MLARLLILWTQIRDSLWLIPSVLTTLGIALALLTVQIDRGAYVGDGFEPFWTFGGGVEGARGVLEAIAGGLITVTGVVFSVTVVALQLASSQFTPRVLRHYTADRTNQVVLGVFIGTFTYTLMVLRSVRSATENGQSFVPSLSVAVAIGSALLSIGFLIIFINHTAQAIQATNVIDRATRETLRLVDRLYPERAPAGVDAPPDRSSSEISLPGKELTTVPADGGGYLQTVATDDLFELARRHHLVIRMEPYVGDFVLPGSALASVWSSDPLDDSVVDAIRRAYVYGKERSPEQDVEFGVRQLVDIAVKALSPGINDPTTASICIDHLAEILVVLANRSLPGPVLSDGEGRGRLIVRQPTFERVADLAFSEIRHFGCGIPSIASKLVETATKVAVLVPRAKRLALARHASLAVGAARRQIKDPNDLALIDRQGSWGTSSHCRHD